MPDSHLSGEILQREIGKKLRTAELDAIKDRALRDLPGIGAEDIVRLEVIDPAEILKFITEIMYERDQHLLSEMTDDLGEKSPEFVPGPADHGQILIKLPLPYIAQYLLLFHSKGICTIQWEKKFFQNLCKLVYNFRFHFFQVLLHFYQVTLIYN